MGKKFYLNDQQHGVEVFSQTRASYLTRVTQNFKSTKFLPKCVQAVEERFRAGGLQFVKKATGTSSIGANVGRCLTTGKIVVITGRLSVKFGSNVSRVNVRQLIANTGGVITHKFRHAKNCFEIRLPIGANVFEIATDLLKNRFCKYATPVLIEEFEQRNVIPTDPLFPKQWFFDKIGAPNAWTTSTGANVRVAIIDWGFHLGNADLKTGIARSGTFTETATHLPASFFPDLQRVPRDTHGTSAASMAIGRANNGKFGCGLAFDADWIPVVALSGGIGTQQSLARAIAYSVDQRTENSLSNESLGADVISISIFPSRSSVVDAVLDDSIRFATKEGRNGLGVPVFYAVDNSDTAITEDAIATHSGVVAVGGTDKLDKRIPCAHGSALAFLAPAKQLRLVQDESTSGTVSGTSFATPLAAAAAALLIQSHPTITRDKVVSALKNTCDKIRANAGIVYDANGHNTRYGHGRINIENALKNAT